MNVIVVFHILHNRTLHACRYEEILLFQAKFFSCHMVVIWIQYFTNSTGKVLLLNCLLIITFIKRIQIESINCLSIPDTKCVYNMVSVTDNRQIIRHCHYGLIIFLYKTIPSGLFVFSYRYITAKTYFNGIFRTLHLKWITIF